MALTTQQVQRLIPSFSGKRIAIVGDLMVDRYYWGSVSRVSPEAPVPVVDVASESSRLGGAANVANNIQSLGGTPVLIGLIGDDHTGSTLLELMTAQGLSTKGIVTDPGRRTTVKTRVIAHDQHVVRIDYETKEAPGPEAEEKLVAAVAGQIADLDAVILEDYNKGVMTPTVIRRVIETARDHGKVVSVDPKFDNFLEYRNVTVFKPNRRETEEVLGGRLVSGEDVIAAGKRMLKDLAAEYILLTRGEDGMTLFGADGGVTHYRTAARHVKDVSGAGDTVIATLTMAMAAGLPAVEAAELANYAGGVVVGSVGIVPILPDALIGAVGRSADSGRT